MNNEQKSMKNISLVGFMGAGKSTISKALALKLDRQRFSSDDLIEAKEKRTIPDIFQTSGEKHFRKVEKQVIKEISQKKGIILDCGGGVVLDPENISNLKKDGIVVFLSASPKVIFDRVKDSTHRPLLQVENPLLRIEELLEQRTAFYDQADFTIDTNSKNIDDICQEIITLL